MISVIVPVYNESDKIDRFIDHLDVFDDEFEVIFSVSGEDDTFEKIRDRGYYPIRSIKGRGNQIQQIFCFSFRFVFEEII